jgi:hypothetical protein
MVTDLLLVLVALLLAMILGAIRIGFNEVIKGLESIDGKLKR